MVYLIVNLGKMISFNAIILFALFNVCAGARPKSTTWVYDGINETHVDQDNTWMNADNVYAFTVKDIKGNDVPMSIYRRKLLLIVNVASKSGLTIYNYKTLKTLHTKYAKKGLVILAFPCNQFMNQEPGTNEEIAAFAKKKGVKFPMFSKINVNGEDASPLWKYLKLKSRRKGDIAISFTKFVVDRNGKILKRYSPLSHKRIDTYMTGYFKF